MVLSSSQDAGLVCLSGCQVSTLTVQRRDVWVQPDQVLQHEYKNLKQHCGGASCRTLCRRSPASCQQRGHLGRLLLALWGRDAAVQTVVQVTALQIDFCSQIDFLQKTQKKNTHRLYHSVFLDFRHNDWVSWGVPESLWCRWGRSWWRRRPETIQTLCW